MSLIGKAFALAADVHSVQTDLSGEPYINHIFAVYHNALRIFDENSTSWMDAEQTARQREIVAICAILHDALEDFEGKTHKNLQLAQYIYDVFGNDVSVTVEHHLTKHTGENYLHSYLPRVASSWRARIVKLADLEHNLSIVRLVFAEDVERVLRRREKYTRAWAYLISEEERWRER